MSHLVDDGPPAEIEKINGGPGLRHQVIGAREADRLELFLASARRLGTAVQNIEKDFRVCWVLDVLFNGMGEGQPRLLFKGGNLALEVIRPDRSLL